ncbi:hypothetical protein CcaverHIS002_0400800 [Cutaneotrichosporon cavernicola]|uniref:Uncharacterized protein n=1 Tax=Cutaneotrichosporon cavernicola TaxID=279322 RepID=A0AA48L3F6_9TREE|nr:uncharacterized protein CcaverHIS019_0400760 [Cutaneotrichosporon cavernicola]BEI83476.1 hypothetical protein CcaverHIS002_0400800 [Cutaneotrichosporon cavernicola]BEI91256.1 hypothetical protein CcaverHIS019_0400760 [Cutaneotrichosporon cavernicola]BEI99029.1 hypothetical protein CcaverHIS631_0400720 [Cutaneotrichosporon cavernicola]BEJ06803.1 hypothetical protein CcaverHIS641_0400720 [Cutaneotrichosporon cavernicola]
MKLIILFLLTVVAHPHAGNKPREPDGAPIWRRHEPEPAHQPDLTPTPEVPCGWWYPPCWKRKVERGCTPWGPPCWKRDDA